ncbi:MAG: SGNH/GDSL hydrolase family protein [Fuerstiella sp.]
MLVLSHGLWPRRSLSSIDRSGLQEKDGIVAELAIWKRTSGLSSNLVGSVVCWLSGTALAAAAVAFSVAGGLTTKAFGIAVLLIGAMICGWARAASPAWKLRLSALLISTSVMLLLAELLLRSLTHYPINTTSNMVPDSELGYVLDSQLSDVDENGFRNASVPDHVDIVAIGDSHTQGLNTDHDNCWPQQLGQRLNQTVYNMGVAGYGPLQYEKLVIQALQRRPKLIFIGLYLGNDISDVTRGIRSRHSAQEVDNSFRHLLKYHTAVGSAVTQLVKRSPAGQPAGFPLAHPVNPTWISTARLRYLTADMDCSDPRLAAALQQTIEILSRADQQCRQQNVSLRVLLIPTRETVYCASQRFPPQSELVELHRLAATEAALRQRLSEQLSQLAISHLDLLPPLAAALDSVEGVYASYDEGHPLSAGYHVYAAALVSSLASTSGP